MSRTEDRSGEEEKSRVWHAKGKIRERAKDMAFEYWLLEVDRRRLIGACDEMASVLEETKADVWAHIIDRCRDVMMPMPKAVRPSAAELNPNWPGK